MADIPTGTVPLEPEPSPGVTDSSVSWSDAWRRLWTPLDPDLIDAGYRGEWLVAGIRLLIILLMISFPLDQFLRSPMERDTQIVLWVAVAALAEALVLYSAVRRSWGRTWIGFLSGFLDVSLVTLSLWIFLRLDQPLAATNDLVIFPVYLLAIGATALRYDWRICVLTGASAIVEYLALVSYSAWQWDLVPLAAEFSWIAQLGRLGLLGVATLLATSLVIRAREQRLLSTRDRLTDLANRGFFDDNMNRLGAIASRSGEPVAVVMIDIDHFKRFNDSHGHLAGDAALKVVAKLLSVSFRTTDMIARYGGEEFAGLFPGMNMPYAVRRMEELRATIEQLPVPVDGHGNTRNVTVSMGVAVWPDDGASLVEVLSIADLRLYQAKHCGRNCVVSTTLEGEQGRRRGDKRRRRP
ncbi:MAG: GGDEF domain-containing protein [bacterium]|nr:GGDEF domain-containing protein [bacterium]